MLEEEPQPPTEIAPEDLPDDASNPEQVARRRTEAGRRDKRLRTTLEGILSIPDGREWIWALLEECNVFSQSFVVGQPESTAFNEGRRSIGNMLLADITKNFPDSFIKMMREQKRNG